VQRLQKRNVFRTAMSSEPQRLQKRNVFRTATSSEAQRLQKRNVLAEGRTDPLASNAAARVRSGATVDSPPGSDSAADSTACAPDESCGALPTALLARRCTGAAR
jgi:hypothetical protein